MHFLKSVPALGVQKRADLCEPGPGSEAQSPPHTVPPHPQKHYKKTIVGKVLTLRINKPLRDTQTPETVRQTASSRSEQEAEATSTNACIESFNKRIYQNLCSEMVRRRRPGAGAGCLSLIPRAHMWEACQPLRVVF